MLCAEDIERWVSMSKIIHTTMSAALQQMERERYLAIFLVQAT